MKNLKVEIIGGEVNVSIPNFLPALNSAGMSFTKREAECFYLLSRFTTVKKIANVLGISPRTVEMHINNIKCKTGISYKAELIEKAIHLFHVSQYINNLKSQPF